jgi:hypothetical protein
MKNIKIKGLDEKDLGALSIQKLTRIENGNNAVSSGQLKKTANKGGIQTLRGRGYTSIQKKGNKTAFEKGVGIHNKENPNYKKWKSEAGSKGAKRQMSDGIGIHTDKETRREWSRAGGLAVIDQLNKEKICPHCKLKSRGAGYNRWHGDNCKLKKVKK